MKVISNDFRDGEKTPLRHVFNGMGYEGDNISRIWPGMKCLPERRVSW